ncbi:PLC-like phosphodiesterase [Sporormia fimetaria CBS 119925]|uniref:Phosphoinositide phospholipase C n=1 Tax=Sporormia fimetaria CBS 119925 TaxID=1340428 RepID=A0A6A6V734_9PLEO|nr:PLC-like phosphodiesterase [Sporormia fimetaria CBS 119925]
MRRVSRGAHGLPNKFRRNGSSTHRDKSSGPVIMRRRSDSRTQVDHVMDMSDLDLNLDADEEDVVEDYADPVNALGISSALPTPGGIPDSSVVGPVRDRKLEQGTRFRKVTKKRVKPIFLRLDLDHARVYWDPSKYSKCFYIDDVKEIRYGLEAKHYREEFNYKNPAYEPYWVTIVYSDTTRSKGRTKHMHLLADDVDSITLWRGALDTVSRERIDMMAGLLGFAEKSAKLVWQREMAKRFQGSEHLPAEETMDLQGITKLCRSLHINCSEDMYHSYFQLANNDGSGKLNQAQFLSFVRKLKERKDIKTLYESLIQEGQSEMDLGSFFAFLVQEQKVDVAADLAHWTTVFEKSARSSKPRTAATEMASRALPLTMDFQAFQTFLTSSANSCWVPPSAVVHDRPLNEYFISSSHNTYLTGRQVVGESSTEAYIAALQKGCRCLEIDCWNGSGGQPIVNHGRTLTTSISFRDTIKVINQYAFCETPYPLILSLEVHCDREQQARMAEIMIEVFGDRLVRTPLSDEAVLPTPEALKGKILIKVKAASTDLDAKPVAAQLDTKAVAAQLSGRPRERSTSSPSAQAVALDNVIIPNSTLLSSPPSQSPPELSHSFWTTPRTSTTSTHATAPSPYLISTTDDSDSPPATDVEKKKKKSSATSKIIPFLGDLGVYTKGYKFMGFTTPEATSYNHIFSIGETKFRKLTDPEANAIKALEEHNMRYLMRVYPSAYRVTSTNFEPLSSWRRGVQMAALNWQTYDLGQQLNEAMFTGAADHTGYVLKPKELRMDPNMPMVAPKLAPKRMVSFAVEIISAQQLPRPKGLSLDANINPYVEFEVFSPETMGSTWTGEETQDGPTRSSPPGERIFKRTRIIPGNGYNPEFREKVAVTLVTRFPSLVFVRWTVWNSRGAQNTERDRPLATFVAKLDNLQQGYRQLPLFDSNGDQYLFSTLFCKIEREAPIELQKSLNTSRSGTFYIDHTSPYQEHTTQQSGRSFLRKLINRTPSSSKRRKEIRLERTYSDPRDGDSTSLYSNTTLD